MTNQEIRADIKGLDDKLDKIMVQVALNTQKIEDMPNKVKNSMIKDVILMIVPVFSALSGVFVWFMHTYLPGEIQTIIRGMKL